MSNGQPAPAVSPVRTEIQQVLDAREKTSAAIAKAKETRVTQVRDLVTNFARQFASSEVDPGRAFELHRQWKARDDQSAERIAALEDLLEKIEDHIETLKNENTEDVAAVLKETIQKLLRDSAEHQQQNQALQARIDKLQAELIEIESPPGGSPPDAAAKAAKRAARHISRRGPKKTTK